ncbi:hypothetical protein HYC85_021570 [Camellia sinensis]|uniref:Sugar phosphate transporter domain-containing protein n=1 Tax=Camellia sinensis TaxID=4442 RepID=A0A7J7GI15_CAMSI|nr:hypothetical protein HYC85_021570 [Camellia sinensis]
MDICVDTAEMSSYFSLFAALSYGVASMAMVFINKAVLMQYASSMTLLTLQQLATTMLIYCGRVMGYTKAKGVNVETAKKLILVSLFYNANVAFALASLKGVNIPMYIAIKRLTPLAVLIAGFFSGKGRPSTQVILSVVLTAAGVMIAALGDFSFDLVGYSMAFTSVFFQTMYLVLVEKSGAEDGLSSVEIIYRRVSRFFVIVICKGPNFFGKNNSRKGSPAHLYSNMLLHWTKLDHEHVLTEVSNVVKTILAAQLCNLLSIGNSSSLSFLVIVLLSLVMGIVLNYTMFLCTIVNSALTTTIVGVLKGVGSTTLGFFLLGGVEVHALNVTGLIINTAGGVWYSYAKYQQRRNKPPKLMSDVESHPITLIVSFIIDNDMFMVPHTSDTTSVAC